MFDLAHAACAVRERFLKPRVADLRPEREDAVCIRATAGDREIGMVREQRVCKMANRVAGKKWCVAGEACHMGQAAAFRFLNCGENSG